ncbi:MAG: ABC-2 transporter permease [Acutalibacteraceae bacterium]|nr:ABC-2 transporter permease [Acutalibacteraceae bacterium]
MKKLFMKEATLCAAPITYIFIAFAAMAMIPGYPILVSAFFVCLGIFYSFQNGRESNDVLFTSLLPVRKSDVVRAKFMFCCAIELASLVLSVILTLMRMIFIGNASPYGENPMMNANFAYLGYTLIIFALFNIIFVATYFKTAYNIGKPFIAFCIISMLFIGVAETLHHLPGLTALNSTDFSGAAMQSIVLCIGIIVYIAITTAAIGISVKRFDKIDVK